MSTRDVIEAELLLSGACIAIGLTIYLSRSGLSWMMGSGFTFDVITAAIYAIVTIAAVHLFGLYIYFTHKDMVEAYR